MELDEMKRILKECVKKGGRYADNLKENGNLWLMDLVSKSVGKDFSELIDEAETFEELMIIWGFINLSRGYNLKKDEEKEEIFYIG